MTGPSPQQLPETWDTVAPTYAEDVAQWIAFAREALRISGVRASDRVLDVASGPGTLAFVAASRVARVDAVDFSPVMVAELSARAEREGVANVEGAVMDAQSLAFPDATFDVAFCLFAFFFFPDRNQAFREILRVLKPGGRAVVGTWAPIERRPVMRLGFEAVAEALPHLPRPSKGDLQDPAECVREMTEAGFRDVVASTFGASIRIESAEHYVDLVVRSGAPFAVLKKNLGDTAFSAVQAKIVEAVRRRLPEVPVELGAEAIFTTGSR